MQLTVEPFTVRKRIPLTIARGTTAQTTNLWLRLAAEGIEGWGEASPFSVRVEKAQTSAQMLQEVKNLAPQLQRFHPLQRQQIGELLDAAQISSSLRAAIDTALHDWLGKRAGLPLWQLWGLERDRIVPTSLTVGISSPQKARERVQAWQAVTEIRRLKVKLGAPAGIEADRAMFAAVQQEAPSAQISVDANGGWDLEDAITMCHWLQEQGVEYVEQPLPVGAEAQLLKLSARSPLPIFVDESCFTSRDIPRLCDRVAGINIKLMKAGGLSEVMNLVQTARACGLQVMYGCYSDSILANTAMAHLAPLADYLDLDSHLNLVDDPFNGAVLQQGCLQPNDLPGLGVNYRASEC